MQITIDTMLLSEAVEVLELVKTCFDTHVKPHYSDYGVATFYDYIDKEAFLKRQGKQHQVYVARVEREKAVAGMVELRANRHVAMLFVRNDRRESGVGRALIRRAIHISGMSGFNAVTVHASPNSVDAYRKFGFEPVREEQIINGIRFTPMRLEIGKKMSDVCDSSFPKTS